MVVLDKKLSIRELFHSYRICQRVMKKTFHVVLWVFFYSLKNLMLGLKIKSRLNSLLRTLADQLRK